MRKNVLILGHSYGSQFVDGYNQYAQLFDPKKYNVTTVYLVGEPRADIEKKTYSENVVFLNCSRKAIRGLKISPIKSLIALCREQKFAIAICHRYKPTYIMLITALFCSIPNIIYVMHAMGTMRSFSRKVIIALLTRKNMLFAGISTAVRDDMRQNVWLPPHDKIITLHNTADINFTANNQMSRSQAREALGLAQDAFIFGQVGRLAREKDQQNFINAFALMKQTCPAAKIVIMGSGPLQADLTTQVQNLTLGDAVIFTGFVEDGFRYMKAFDVYVSTSTKEAFGRAVLEAMIAKIPIIATHIGGVPELVGETGQLVPPANSALLAESMQGLYQSERSTREAMGENGYQRAQRLFSFAYFQKIFWQLPILKIEA